MLNVLNICRKTQNLNSTTVDNYTKLLGLFFVYDVLQTNDLFPLQQLLELYIKNVQNKTTKFNSEEFLYEACKIFNLSYY